MNCGHDKATKLLVELDSGKGFGLIERIRQGQGRPTKIYVKRFTTREIPPRPALPQAPPSSQECGKVAAQTAEKPQSGLRNIRRQECGKPAASYIESNQTDFIYTDPSIYPAQPPPNMEWIDRNDCRREVEERIEAQALRRQFGYDDVESVVELMTDTLCSTRPTLRIGGEEIPAEQVKGRFLSLDYGHLEYVFDCLRRNTTQIRNIRAYLLTTLYNSYFSANSGTMAQVQHDLYGKGGDAT